MELFVIQCTTCRARLKVHDPALVGNIVECPKCGSFVQVAPPANWQPPAGGTATAGSAAWSTEPPSGKSSNQKRASGSPSNQFGAAGSDQSMPVKAAKSSAKNQPAASQTAAALVPATIKQAFAAPPPLPPKIAAPTAQAAASKSASAAQAKASNAAVPKRLAPSGRLAGTIGQARSHWVLATGCAAAGLVIVAIVWIVLSSSGDSPVAVEQQEKSSLTSDKSDDHATGAGTQANGTAAHVGQDSNVVAHPATEVQEKLNSGREAEHQGGGVPASSAPGRLVNSTGQDSKAPSAASDSVPAVQPPATSPADPIDKLAGELTQGSSTQGADKPAASSSAPSADSAEKNQVDPAKQAALMAHLKDKVPAIEFNNVALGQFAAFLSEFSTVPIAIDSQSLLDIGKGAKTRIKVQLSNASVEEVLRSALASQGLAFDIEPGRVVITAAAKQK